jgi:phosphatidate cytidylyltransferase
MTRVLSAVAMLAIVVGTVWWLPSWATLGLAELVVLLALVEYVDLAERAGAPAPKGLVVVAGLAICAAVARDAAVVTVLMAATVAVGAAAVGKPRGRASGGWTYAAGVFGPLYVGLPLGTLVAIHAERGAETVLLLLAVIVASDAAQFYGGRALGRRPLAPATSPKKTIEGAFCGVLAGSAVMAVASGWGGLAVHPAFGAAFGAALAGIGIVGDLFESKLKREAGVKDVSGLIPGHGGVMDRLDSWLFAIPLFDAVFRGLSA